MRKAYNTIRPYNSQAYLVTEGANAIMIKNEGDVAAKINSLLSIAPGETLSIAQVSAEVTDHTQYELQFDLSSPSTTGTNQLVVVVCIGIEK